MSGAPNAELVDGGVDSITGVGTLEELNAGVKSTMVVAQADLDAARNWRCCAPAANGVYFTTGSPAELTAKAGLTLKTVFVPACCTLMMPAKIGEAIMASQTAALDTTAFAGVNTTSVVSGNVSLVTTTGGGVGSAFKLNSAAATTNPNLIKNGSTRAYKVRGYNAAAYPVFIKTYNKATAPVAGTDTPVYTIACKPADVFDHDLGAPGIGFGMTLGLGICITKLAADADTTVLVAGDVVGLTFTYV